jgi:hypothetical protein
VGDYLIAEVEVQPTVYGFRHYLAVGEEYGHRSSSDTARLARGH